MMVLTSEQLRHIKTLNLWPVCDITLKIICAHRNVWRQYTGDKMLPDVAELVECLNQIGLHHGVTEPSDVDDWGRGDAVTVLHAVLQREENLRDCCRSR